MLEFCCRCGKVGEDLGLMDPYMRVTRRMANYIIELCKLMSIREVAEHLGLDWKTVKEIHKRYLKDCLYPLHTSSLEGINNKIKVIKRKAYGFHDVEYFSLVIKNAFAESN